MHPVTNTTRAHKQALRQTLKAQRAALTQARRAEMDAAITEQVLALPPYCACTILFSYVSVREEVDTRALIQAALRDGKQVAVPRCEGKRMVFYRIDSLEQLVLGRYDLPEPPVGVPAVPDNHSICLVPGFSFDRSGARVGYGGGFYDRFLPDFPGVSVGLCYAPLLANTPLPSEPHDCDVDFVVSDREIWKTTTNSDGNR